MAHLPRPLSQSNPWNCNYTMIQFLIKYDLFHARSPHTNSCHLTRDLHYEACFFFKVNMIAIKTLIFIHVNQVTGLLQIKTDFSRTFALKKKPEAKRGCNLVIIFCLCTSCHPQRLKRIVK